MRTLRYYFRLTLTFINRFKGLILLSSFLGIISFFILLVIIPKFFTTSLETIGITGRFQIDTLPNEFLHMIGDGLTTVNEKGIPQPNLASSWETPDKGKTWIFHLKDNIKWQDNKKLISSDINYNFSDVDVEYPDSKTITFRLKEIYLPFPVVVSKPVFKKGLLGTGDWRVKNISIFSGFVQKITINKNKEQIIYKFYPTEEQTKLAYKMGEIRKIINLSNPKPFDSWNNSNTNKIINYKQTVAIFFNTQDSVFSEKTLRQALNYAIDKESFDSVRSISPININSFAYNPQVKKYSYDLTKAKELVNGLPKDLTNKFPVKLVSTPSLLSVAEKVSSDWKSAGVETQVLVTSVVPSDYQAYLTIFDIPDDPDQYFLWHSTQTNTNITKYKNPRIDKLLEDGRLESSLEERKKIYLDFQRFVVEDSPAIFLYYPIWYNVERK